MKTIKLQDIDLYEIGQSYQIAGVVWTGKGISFVTQIPGKDEDLTDLQKMPLTMEEWQKLNRQADLLETEIFAKDPTGFTKVIVRKTQRQLDGFLQWQCWARDNYMCRYCGRQNTPSMPVPLSVDHVDLWEDGGPAILINLITACKPCNKDRGRMQYEDWLKSPIYLQKSKNLSPYPKKLNEDLLLLLPEIRTKRVQHIRSRG